jgi:hypothetical protein
MASTCRLLIRRCPHIKEPKDQCDDLSLAYCLEPDSSLHADDPLEEIVAGKANFLGRSRKQQENTETNRVDNDGSNQEERKC